MAGINSTFERIRKIQQMLDEKEYISGSEKMPVWRRIAHFCILVVKSFQKNRGPVRAAALSYNTVLALVPMLAVAVSISTAFLQNDKGRVIDRTLDYFITAIAPKLDLMQASDDAFEAAVNRQEVVDRIRGYIETVNSGALGLTAGIVLVAIAVMVLSAVETTFNDIWGVNHGRTWSSRIVQYWAAITLGPIFIVTAMAVTTTAQIVSAAKDDPVRAEAILTHTNRVETAAATNQTGAVAVPAQTPTKRLDRQNLTFIQKMVLWSYEAPILGTLVAKFGKFVLPFVVFTTFLTLFYKLMPATRVAWSAALVGGLVGGGLLQLNNLFNIVYFSRIATYSKIYGGLGAVPIFLVGLYFAWLIVLLGAQVAYAFQNRLAYVQEKQAETIHQRGREFVALRLMAYIAQKFYLGQSPPTRSQMSNALAIPSQLACQVLANLSHSKLLVEASGEEVGYTPARPIDKITVDDILAGMRVGQGTDLATADDPSREVVRSEFDRVNLAEMQAAGAVSLHALVLRMASLPQKVESAPVSKPPEPPPKRSVPQQVEHLSA